MKRIAIKLAVFLLLGAVVNVGVAWLAMFIPTGSQWYGPPATEDLGLAKEADSFKTWQISRGRNAWHTVVTYWPMQVSGLSFMIPTADFEARRFDVETLPQHSRPASLEDLYMNAWYHETGFPLGALACSVHWKEQIRNADIIYSVKDGVQLPRDPQFNPRALPLAPVWPGFAVNTALYAAILWLLLATPFATRRLIRRRRGCCIRCGYDRRGAEHDVCPECGAEALE